MKYADIVKQFQEKDKKNCCYLGIKKSEFPKWTGWKLIEYYKSNGVKVCNINDHDLEVMVENFYMIMFLKKAKNFFTDEKFEDR